MIPGGCARSRPMCPEDGCWPGSEPDSNVGFSPLACTTWLSGWPDWVLVLLRVQKRGRLAISIGAGLEHCFWSWRAFQRRATRGHLVRRRAGERRKICAFRVSLHLHGRQERADAPDIHCERTPKNDPHTNLQKPLAENADSSFHAGPRSAPMVTPSECRDAEPNHRLGDS